MLRDYRSLGLPAWWQDRPRRAADLAAAGALGQRETEPRGAMGLGGKDEQFLAALGVYMTAIDYKTGKVAWQHKYSEAGDFGGCAGRVDNHRWTPVRRRCFGEFNYVQCRFRKDPVACARLGNVSNAPQTY